MLLLITRHGETIENIEGIIQGQMDGTLSENGIVQAVKTGERLKNMKIDYIISSDLGRSKKTAEIISSRHVNKNLKILYEERLRERNNGIFQGKKKSDIITEHGNQITITDFLMLNGAESPESMYKRASLFINEIFENYGNDINILLVGHGGINSSIFAYLEGLGPNIGYIPNKNCSISIYEKKDLIIKKLLFDDDVHLL